MTQSLRISTDTTLAPHVPTVCGCLEIRLRGHDHFIGVSDVRHVDEAVAGLGREARVVLDIGDARLIAWTAMEFLAGQLKGVASVEVRGSGTAVAQLVTALSAMLRLRSYLRDAE